METESKEVKGVAEEYYALVFQGGSYEHIYDENSIAEKIEDALAAVSIDKLTRSQFIAFVYQYERGHYSWCERNEKHVITIIPKRKIPAGSVHEAMMNVLLETKIADKTDWRKQALDATVIIADTVRGKDTADTKLTEKVMGILGTVNPTFSARMSEQELTEAILRLGRNGFRNTAHEPVADKPKTKVKKRNSPTKYEHNKKLRACLNDFVGMLMEGKTPVKKDLAKKHKLRRAALSSGWLQQAMDDAEDKVRRHGGVDKRAIADFLENKYRELDS
jgi:hypothetical protein